MKEQDSEILQKLKDKKNRISGFLNYDPREDEFFDDLGTDLGTDLGI